MEHLDELAVRVSRNDGEAFRQIVAATSARLVRLAARMLGSLEEAEDVVQESYVKAYRALVSGAFDHRSSVSTWLYRIVSNAAVDALRGRARRPVATDTLHESAWDGAASAEARLALVELDDWLDGLPPEQRAALVLKSIEGHSSSEVAEILGITEGAVEQKLVRARAALRKKRQDDD